MTGGAEASVIWQTTGKCPSVVKVETPIGKTLYLDIIPKEFGVCGVVKDAGDDPDVTNGSEIITKVELFEEEGDISFFGGDGVGTIKNSSRTAGNQPGSTSDGRKSNPQNYRQ